MIKAEAGANRGLAVAPHIPGKADARLGEEDGAILAERRTSDDGVGLQNAVDDCVVCGAALCFVPAVGRFEAEAGAQFETRRELDGVFHEARAFKRAPAEFGGRGDDGEGLHRALQKSLQRGERGLSILILRQQVVGLNALQPDARLRPGSARASSRRDRPR